MARNADRARKVNTWGWRENLSAAWIVFALVAAMNATAVLSGALPIFTFVWLVVPLLVLLRHKNAALLGIRAVDRGLLLRTTATNLGVLLVIMALVEPWSHTYRLLVTLAVSSRPPDTTFAWLARFDGWPAWLGLLFYSGLVTLFAEELFFRGWLLQTFMRRMRPAFAIALQAALFTLPNLIPVLLFPPLQGALYALVYAWLAIGVVGGWAAARTNSIWPSLITATIVNFVLTFLIISNIWI